MDLRLTRLTVWLTFQLLVISAFSQDSGTLLGVVTDQDKQPVVGATVLVGETFAPTDINGNYFLTLPSGLGRAAGVTVSSMGYETLKATFQVPGTGQQLVQDFQLKPIANDLGIVVVSAGKFEQDISELTVSMEVLKPELIEAKNTINMDDILQQTPGVVIVDSEPQIRGGSGYSFGAGSRVQILVDDLPMLSGDAGRPVWGFLPVENIEQIEVIKGASSVLYGSAALSGVINVRTAWPGGEPRTKIQTFHGFYSDPPKADSKYWEGTPMMTGISGFHSQSFGNLDLVVGLNLMGNDSYKGPLKYDDGSIASSKYDPTDVNRYDADKRMRINLNSRYQVAKVPGLTLGLNTNWLKGESYATLLWEDNIAGLFSSYDGAATLTKQVIGNVDPSIEYLSAGGSRHSLRGRWQSLDNDNDNDQGNFSDVYYGSYQYQKRLDSMLSGLNLTAGLVAQHTDGRGELYTGGSQNGNNTATNYAAFLQLDQKIADVLNVSAGVRYESFSINGESESKPVFRAGANWQLAEATFLRGSFGQGYRFPSIAEKFIQTQVGLVAIYPNPELRSETSFNLEFGMKQGFKIGNFKGYADVAWFMQRFENFIEFTFSQWSPDPSGTNLFGLGFKSVNTGEAQVTGVDFSILGEGQLGKVKLSVLGGYTYTKPISTTPDLVFANSAADPDDLIYLSAYENMTFNSTSSNSTDNILKYRLQHLIRMDIQADYEALSVGASFRYNSRMQNIDQAFIDFDTPDLVVPGSDPLVPTGVIDWRAEHDTGDPILDARLGWRVSEVHKVALVVNNILNREYAIRPLSIEPTRSVIVQYTITL